MIQTRLHPLSQAFSAVQVRGADVEIRGVCTDSRQVQAGNLYVALSGERFDGHAFVAEAAQLGASALLVERALDSPLPQLIVPATRQALGELAGWWRQRFQLPLVAVTGSNGKTTVKEMLAAIFRQSGSVLATQGNLNNDIGLPLTLLRLSAAHQYAVIEMGANHPGEIAWLTHLARPQVALITQCAPAHLAGFGSIEGVATAKGEIYAGLAAEGTAVINADDPYADFWSSLNKTAQRLRFGLQAPAEVTASQIDSQALSADFTLVTPVGTRRIHLPLAGRHNIANALAASAAALAVGGELDAIVAGLASMQAVPGRLQRRLALRAGQVIDDTYNANPASLAAALHVLAACPAPRYLVLGDMLELGETALDFHRRAGELAQSLGIEWLLTTGTLSAAAATAFGNQATHFDTTDDLIAALREQLLPQATVLVKGSRGARMERVVQALLANV